MILLIGCEKGGAGKSNIGGNLAVWAALKGVDTVIMDADPQGIAAKFIGRRNEAGLRKALKDSKGPGNFRNLFVYAPNGKKDGLQVIPVSEVAAKDEFFNIKNVTRDDIMAAHRVPPQLMGIIPNNTGGFGDAGKAAQVFYHHEVMPLQERFKELNQWLGEEVVTFKPYEMALADK